MVESLYSMLGMGRKNALSGICELWDFCFRIPCCSQVMPIGGSSGSGKTYFIKLLKRYMKENISDKHKILLTDGFDRNKLHVMLHPNELDYVSDSLECNFFIIDKFSYATKAQVEKAQQLIHNHCTFVVCARYDVPLKAYGLDKTLELKIEMLDNGMRYFNFYYGRDGVL